MNIDKLKMRFLLASAIVLIIGAFSLPYLWNNNLKNTSDNALELAKVTEVSLNGEMFKLLRAIPEDLGTPAYESLKSRLINLPQIVGDIRFAYIYTQRDGQIYFMVDSEPTSSKDYSSPGQKYTEASDEYYKPFRDGLSLITKPTKDRWGTWVSVLVPMKDFQTGEIKAVFAFDYPADKWTNEAFWNTMLSFIVLLVAFLLIITRYNVVKGQFKIKESEEKYRALVNNSHQIIYTLSTNGDVTFVSPAWTALLKYPLSDVVGKNMIKFLHPDDVPKVKDFMQKVIDTKRRTDSPEYRVKDIDGVYHWHKSEIGPFLNNFGEIIGLFGVAWDIEEDRKTQEKLKNTLDETIKLNKLMVDREIKMVELKKEISDLKNLKK